MRRSILPVLFLCCAGFAQEKSNTEKSASAKLSSLVPPDTMLLLECDDLGGYERWIKETSLGRIWADPQMQQFLGGMKSAIADAIASQQQQGRDPLGMVGLKPADLLGIVPQSGGVALIDLDLQKRGYPDLLITMEFRAGVEGMQRVIDAVRTAAGMFAGVGFQREQLGDNELLWADLPFGGQIAYTFVGNRMLMASSQTRLKDSLTRLAGGRAANLEGHPAFGEALRTMGARHTGTLLYVDATRLRERVLAMLTPMIGDDMAEVRRIMGAVGLDAIERVVVADIPHDRNVRTEFLVQLAERKGVFSLMPSAPTSHRFAAYTPRDPLYYAAERADLGSFIDAGFRLADTLKPGASGEAQRIIARYNAVLGIDLRQDLVGSFGDEWAAYVCDPPQGGLMPDMVLFASVKDRAALQNSLRALVEKYDAINAMYGERAVRRAPKIRHRKTTFGDHAIHCIEITDRRGEPIPIMPCWTMGEDYVAFALWPNSLRNALQRKPSLADNPRFQSLRAGIPEGAVSATYLDLPRLVGWAYNSAAPILQGIQGAINRQIAPYGASLNFHDLPQAEVITSQLTPVLGYTKVEDNSIRMGYVSPFGLSLSLAAPAGIGAIAALLAVRMEAGGEVEASDVRAVQAEEQQEAADRERLERRLAELERQLAELRKLLER